MAKTDTKTRKEIMSKKGVSLRNFNMEDELYSKLREIAQKNRRTATAEFNVAVANHIKREGSNL